MLSNLILPHFPLHWRLLKTILEDITHVYCNHVRPKADALGQNKIYYIMCCIFHSKHISLTLSINLKWLC